MDWKWGVAGWIMGPKIILSSSPGPVNVTLSSKRTFIYVIKDFEMERLLWIIQMSPEWSHECLYKTEAEGDSTTEKKVWGRLEEDATLLALEMETQDKECSFRKWKRQGNGLSPKLGWNLALLTLWVSLSDTDFKFLTSRTLKRINVYVIIVLWQNICNIVFIILTIYSVDK